MKPVTPEEAKRILPLIQARAEGKDVEFFFEMDGVWADGNDREFFPGYKWRIKPKEPTYGRVAEVEMNGVNCLRIVTGTKKELEYSGNTYDIENFVGWKSDYFLLYEKPKEDLFQF